MNEDKIIAAIRKILDMPCSTTDKLIAIRRFAYKHTDDVGFEIADEIEVEFAFSSVSEGKPQS